MGIYLNPENENFKEILRSEIYVDKTMMISKINRFMDTNNKYICVSRPRRFGKTYASNMLSAYYSRGCDSRDLFAGLKISASPDYLAKLNQYNVIKIDLNSEYQNTENKDNLVKILTGKIKAEMKATYSDLVFPEEYSLADAIQEVYIRKKEKFVLLIDEYDVLVREQVDKDLFENYLSFLNGLFKSDTLRPAIALAYLTGILPMVRDKIQSKLNNFEEYTMLDAFELVEYVGFTDQEVQNMCRQHKVDYEECKRWYDGYRQNGVEIYNPESVVKCMRTGKFANYWGKTSSYAVISDRLRENFDGMKDAVIRMLSGEAIKVNVTKYLNTMESFEDMDDVFTYLLHVGYLSFDEQSSTCRIPNGEIRREWSNAISAEKGYEMTSRIIKESEGLLEKTLQGNAEAVAEALDTSHMHVTSNRSYNNEDALCSAIYLAYIYALNEYTCIKEMTAGKGFADMVYIPVKPDRPALIIELKRNDIVDSAMDQIREKQYDDALAHYSGELLFVGINYDEKKKEHTCRIERLEK